MKISGGNCALRAKSDVHFKRQTDIIVDSLFSSSVCMLRGKLVTAYTMHGACRRAPPHSLPELTGYLESVDIAIG